MSPVPLHARSRILEDHEKILCRMARHSAELVARRLFVARGNPSEVHLNEYELALCVAVAVDAALHSAIDRAEATL